MAQSHAQSSDWDDTSSLRLYLTTIAGTVIQTQVPVSIHHTWEMLEEYLVEHLPLVSHIDTFGCELTLLDADTHLALQDPIQDDLWWNTQFCLIVHECLLTVERKEQLQGLEYEDCPKAIRVPANDLGILEAKAFFSTARVRHVRVDTGFHTVSRPAWRYCHSLRIVKLPDTVVAIGYAAFQGCYSLKTVEMPGCVELGVRLFSECCALGAVIGQYAFEECARLAQLSLPHVRAMMDSATLATPQAEVPQGSFYASGRQVELGSDACYIGHRAYESCKLLTLVDISRTEVHILHMHTFSQCHSLETVKLPSCLREIRAEVFIGCKALVNLTLPGSIRYTGYRAFGNCAELSHLGYARNKLEAWRYPAFNAFEECVKLATPKWLHYIPPRESDWIAPCN